MAKKLHQRIKGKAPWSVVVKPRVRFAGSECWGLCDFVHRQITLSKATEKAGIDRYVFLHEMIHKICPWMDEDAVVEMATELDEALDVVGL